MKIVNIYLLKNGTFFSILAFQIVVAALLVVVVMFAYACKKEAQDNWQLCSQCPVELITGTYAGKADHVKRLDTANYVTTRGKDAYMTISATSSGVAVQCGVINLFGATFSGSYQNSYHLTMPGFSSSLNCRIWRDGEKVKIAGTAKKLDASGETTELLDFEVYKKID